MRRAPYVVIMAGGSGTRFWPLSRRARPKQFLTLGGTTSLLRQTVDRVLPLASWERLLIVTAAEHADHVTRELPELPAQNLLVEPVGRNTAPCVGWATREILMRDDSPATVVALPADHVVTDAADFREHLAAAIEAASSDRIVLLGLQPTHPETGFGYIQRGPRVLTAGGKEIHAVTRFVEKPDRATAERYLASGEYLWNSGMFVFAAHVMDRAIELHLPELARSLDRLKPDTIERVYPTLPEISIDNGVMEKAKDVLVLPSTFPWSDVGSWDAARDVRAPREADADGNILGGDVVAVDTKRTMVEAAGNRVVAVVGVEDLIVVDTEDALLVVPRGRSQEVRKIIEALKARGRKELL